MKRYLRAMSLDRATARKQMQSFSPVIMEHIIKLLMYSSIRPNDVKGWIHTVANWIYQADDMTIKPSSKKPKESDIIDYLFSSMGTDIRDYERALYAFQADNASGKFNYNDKGSYPEFEIDIDAARDLMELCEDVKTQTLPLLRDKKNHSLAEYEAIISIIMNNIR